MQLWTDIRYALRVLGKSRGFTFVAVLTLAVSIGANTTIFSMADAIVFHPYPFPELDRVVSLAETIPAVSAERFGVSAGDYFDWEDQNRAFCADGGLSALGRHAHRSSGATVRPRLSGFLPSRRAARVDPMIALRSE